MNLQCRNPPGVNFFLIELRVVFVVRQTFAVPGEGESPWSRPTQRLLEFCSKARLRNAPLPSVPMTASLEAVAPEKTSLFCLHIAEPRNINNIGSSSDYDLVFVARNNP